MHHNSTLSIFWQSPLVALVELAMARPQGTAPFTEEGGIDIKHHMAGALGSLSQLAWSRTGQVPFRG